MSTIASYARHTAGSLQSRRFGEHERAHHDLSAGTDAKRGRIEALHSTADHPSLTEHDVLSFVERGRIKGIGPQWPFIPAHSTKI